MCLTQVVLCTLRHGPAIVLVQALDFGVQVYLLGTPAHVHQKHTQWRALVTG